MRGVDVHVGKNFDGHRAMITSVHSRGKGRNPCKCSDKKHHDESWYQSFHGLGSLFRGTRINRAACKEVFFSAISFVFPL